MREIGDRTYFGLSAGLAAALASALLFGATTPIAKQLLNGASPLLVAGLLYLGSGVGLTLLRLVQDRGLSPTILKRSDWPWLAAATASGGVLAPALLLVGLAHSDAATASLLLNLEVVFTAVLALALGARLPTLPYLSGTLVLGFLGYGVSLVLFIVALRQLGTARTGAYFATAPFIGTALAVFLYGQPVSVLFWIAALLMGVGVYLHVTEQHVHMHTHEPLRHTHAHVHDAHHQHEHPQGWDGAEPHTHEHQHEPLRHSHEHFPDIHHRHRHG